MACSTNSQVGVRNREVRFTPKIRHRSSGLPSLKSAANRRLVHRSNHQHIQSPDPWQNDLKFRARTRRTVKIEPTAQTVRHDVVEDMQAKACTA
jgi:hypothetical protein